MVAIGGPGADTQRQVEMSEEQSRGASSNAARTLARRPSLLAASQSATRSASVQPAGDLEHLRNEMAKLQVKLDE